jgi:hypothetical protein
VHDHITGYYAETNFISTPAVSLRQAQGTASEQRTPHG